MLKRTLLRLLVVLLVVVPVGVGAAPLASAGQSCFWAQLGAFNFRVCFPTVSEEQSVTPPVG